jgi:hypothetical protein
MLATVLAVVGAAFPLTTPVQASGGCRVGRIIIEGNTQTPDRVIQEQLRLLPGQKFTARDLLAAQDRLRKCGFFPVNPWRGIGPTVQVLPNEIDSEFLDVRVRIDERTGNWLRYGVREVMLTTALGDRIEVGFAVWWVFDEARERISHKQH